MSLWFLQLGREEPGMDAVEPFVLRFVGLNDELV